MTVVIAGLRESVVGDRARSPSLNPWEGGLWGGGLVLVPSRKQIGAGQPQLCPTELEMGGSSFNLIHDLVLCDSADFRLPLMIVFL
jgi:hypothetical protein